MDDMEQTYTITLELIDSKVDEIKAMLIEVLTWKSELEASMADMQNGGLLQVVSKMFGAK